MSSELSNAIRTHKAAFSLELTDETISRIEKYYSLLLEHNPILHLIGPMDAEEFAIRHILESLMLLKYLPADARFADVGSGGGLPGIPCLLARDHLNAILIESKEKKTKFLELAVEELGLGERVRVVTRQFQESDISGCEFVTCRALDKFTENLPRLLRWGGTRTLLFFGNEQLGDALQKAGLELTRALMPMSERRFLFRAVRPR